mmetsp:Transcript_55149/g.142060  ORF Transcript_55149/g.142060 Transcript_55149/m.142060 type:complete len:158 (-) Transcript_55149:232-705(-)
MVMERRSRRSASPLALCCSLAVALLLWQSSTQAFVGSAASARPALRSGLVQLAAAEEGKEAEEEVAPPPPRRPRDGITDNLRNRLRDEAQAMGDSDTPITAGFGNPYLVVIVVVLVLGAASYFSLGLDKIGAKQAKISDQEMIKNYQKMQESMYGQM